MASLKYFNESTQQWEPIGFEQLTNESQTFDVNRLLNMENHTTSSANPHSTNSGQVNVVSGLNSKAKTVNIINYPLGITIMKVSPSWDTSLGSEGGTVLTSRHNHLTGDVGHQIFYADSIVVKSFIRYCNASGWTAWEQIETTNGSQLKVNTHANRKDNPHEVNSSQITKIPAIQDATVSGENYPAGVTIFTVTTGSTGYPGSGFGTVMNIKDTNTRFTQYYYSNGSVATSRGSWYRHWYTGLGWTAWTKAGSFSYLSAKKTSNLSVAGSTYTKIVFDEIYNTDNSANYNTTNGRFTAPETGTYRIDVEGNVNMAKSNTNNRLTLYKNGQLHRHVADFYLSNAEERLRLTGTELLTLNKGDYLEIYAYQGHEYYRDFAACKLIVQQLS